MRLLAAALALLCASTTWAQDDIGFYIGANFGATRLDAGDSARDLRNDLVAIGFSSAQASIDESGTGYRIFAGYQLSRNFALEGYYAHLGEYDLSASTTGPVVNATGEVEVKGFGVDAVAILPFNSVLSGLGRIGLFRWDADMSIRAVGPAGTATGSDSDDGTDLKLGVGIEWKLGPRLRLRGELEYYAFDDAITMLSVGLLYRF